MMRRIALLIIVALVVTSAASAQVNFVDEQFAFDKDQPQVGFFVGNVNLPTTPPRIVVAILSVTKDGDGLKVRLTLPAIGAMDKECVAVSADDSMLIFQVVGAGGTYVFKGEIDTDGQRFAGQVAQIDKADDGEEPSPFEFRRTLRPTDLPEPLAFTGDLSAQGMKMAMTIVLAQTPGKNWVGHIDVPMQFLNAFPLINLYEQDGVIHGEMSVPGEPQIDVSIDEKKLHMTGTFRQSGFELAVDFARDTNYAYKEMSRPQHPKPPFAYQTQEIQAPHPDGFSLAGTLTIPESAKFGQGPFPVAVLVSGSGQQDRDESLLGHKPFLVIADYLTNNGIAVMRYDDRGVGGSGGRDTLENATTQDFATDALAVINQLKTLDIIDNSKIGIIGHSEGGLIAPIVATTTDDIAYLVLLAGPGVKGSDLLAVQRKLLTMAAGSSEEAADQANEQFAMIEQKIQDGATVDELVELFVKMSREQSPDLAITDEELTKKLKPQASTLMGAWFQYFMNYDPQPTLAKLKCPVLALNGTLDLQVWHEQNLDAIDRVMTESGGDITIIRYQGLNHLFQPAITGSVGEYAQIEITIDEQVLSDIVKWIKAKIGE